MNPPLNPDYRAIRIVMPLSGDNVIEIEAKRSFTKKEAEAIKSLIDLCVFESPAAEQVSEARDGLH